jgi:hypothetical protein
VAIHPDLLGKEEEAEDWRRREFPCSMYEGLFIITAGQVDPIRGSTGALEVKADLHSQATQEL